MSHKSLSIGMLPIVRLKKASSIVLAFTVLRAGIKRRIFPNLTLLLGYCVRVYSLSMSWAWSCKASTWLESLRPLTSAKRKPSYMNSYFKKFTCNWLKKYYWISSTYWEQCVFGDHWQLFDVVSYSSTGSRVMFNIFGLVRIKDGCSITSLSIERNHVGKHIHVAFELFHPTIHALYFVQQKFYDQMSFLEDTKLRVHFLSLSIILAILALSLLSVKLFSIDFNLP